MKKSFQGAAQRKLKRYKGKYIGPDKYKGKIPKHLRHKYKGEYFGKESGKGLNLGSAKNFKKQIESPSQNVKRTSVVRRGTVKAMPVIPTAKKVTAFSTKPKRVGVKASAAFRNIG